MPLGLTHHIMYMQLITYICNMAYLQTACQATSQLLLDDHLTRGLTAQAVQRHSHLPLASKFKTCVSLTTWPHSPTQQVSIFTTVALPHDTSTNIAHDIISSPDTTCASPQLALLRAPLRISTAPASMGNLANASAQQLNAQACHGPSISTWVPGWLHYANQQVSTPADALPHATPTHTAHGNIQFRISLSYQSQHATHHSLRCSAPQSRFCAGRR